MVPGIEDGFVIVGQAQSFQAAGSPSGNSSEDGTQKGDQVRSATPKNQETSGEQQVSAAVVLPEVHNADQVGQATIIAIGENQLSTSTIEMIGVVNGNTNGGQNEGTSVGIGTKKLKRTTSDVYTFEVKSEVGGVANSAIAKAEHSAKDISAGRKGRCCCKCCVLL